MKTIEIPKGVQEVLASCPRTGAGVHRWLFTTALKLHRRFADKDELASLLAEATSNCGREVPEREIAEAVRDSQPIAEGETDPARKVPRWPRLAQDTIEAIACRGPSLAQLEALSPVRWTDGLPHTEQVINALFPGNPLLCGGPKQEFFITRTREEWRGFLAKQGFVVPSPMSAVFGRTKDGKRSMHTLSNTGPRRFTVVENDQGTFDQHAALLAHLGKYARLVLVVHSGNKSLHGWFYCAGQPDEKVEKFFRYAVSLGADPHTWVRSQFVRMPDGLRDNGARQRVMFFNPKPMEAK